FFFCILHNMNYTQVKYAVMYLVLKSLFLSAFLNLMHVESRVLGTPTPDDFLNNTIDYELEICYIALELILWLKIIGIQRSFNHYYPKGVRGASFGVNPKGWFGDQDGGGARSGWKHTYTQGADLVAHQGPWHNLVTNNITRMELAVDLLQAVHAMQALLWLTIRYRTGYNLLEMALDLKMR
ncbi:hypothetical protein ACJX0J_006914, partial [Zea mays]